MSGVFPSSGVPAAQTVGADTSIVAADLANCADGALFHSTARCEPRFDPAAANFVLSEIVNLVKCAGLDYNCGIFNNLCLAVQAIAEAAAACDATGVAAGTYGDATNVSQITVDACGRITSAANVPIAFPGQPGGTPLTGPTPANPVPVGAYTLTHNDAQYPLGTNNIGTGQDYFAPLGGSVGSAGTVGPTLTGEFVCTGSSRDETALGFPQFTHLWYRSG